MFHLQVIGYLNFGSLDCQLPMAISTQFKILDTAGN